MSMTASEKIVRLKVTLRDVKPAVTRRIEVPLDLRLDRLHEVLQAAAGWMGNHLWEFWARDARWGRKWEDDDFIEGPSDASKATLLDIVEGMGAKSFKYIYDFGDNWEHMIKVERIADAEPGVVYPRLIAAAGRCPPEDVGGSWGYANFLEAIADPAHERHGEMTEWYDGPFDPAIVDIPAIEIQLAALTKHRSRPKAKRRSQGVR
jgi:hypothetical protein